MRYTKQNKLDAINYLASHEIKLQVMKDFDFYSTKGFYVFCIKGDIIYYTTNDRRKFYIHLQSDMNLRYYEIKLEDAWNILNYCKKVKE